MASEAMSVETKICGVKTRAALEAAAAGGAAWIGLNFYPPSPRAVSAEEAAALAAATPPGVGKVGLFVDPDDALLEEVLGQVAFDLLQLHGGETPARVAEIRARFGLPVMKAIKIAGPEDLALADEHIEVADRLLFDAKAPKSMKNALPGGNALKFDWQLLAGRTWAKPWMLSGGLTAENLAEAVATSGACAVDVSSGVESEPGLKDPKKIRDFLEAARRL